MNKQWLATETRVCATFDDAERALQGFFAAKAAAAAATAAAATAAGAADV